MGQEGLPGSEAGRGKLTFQTLWNVAASELSRVYEASAARLDPWEQDTKSAIEFLEQAWVDKRQSRINHQYNRLEAIDKERRLFLGAKENIDGVSVVVTEALVALGDPALSDDDLYIFEKKLGKDQLVVNTTCNLVCRMLSSRFYDVLENASDELAVNIRRAIVAVEGAQIRSTRLLNERLSLLNIPMSELAVLTLMEPLTLPESSMTNVEVIDVGLEDSVIWGSTEFDGVKAAIGEADLDELTDAIVSMARAHGVKIDFVLDALLEDPAVLEDGVVPNAMVERSRAILDAAFKQVMGTNGFSKELGDHTSDSQGIEKRKVRDVRVIFPSGVEVSGEEMDKWKDEEIQVVADRLSMGKKCFGGVVQRGDILMHIRQWVRRDLLDVNKPIRHKKLADGVLGDVPYVVDAGIHWRVGYDTENGGDTVVIRIKKGVFSREDDYLAGTTWRWED